MSTELILPEDQKAVGRKDAGSAIALPNLIEREGPKTTKRFLEFFTANIRNKNTRAAYARASGNLWIGVIVRAFRSGRLNQ